MGIKKKIFLEEKIRQIDKLLRFEKDKDRQRHLKILKSDTESELRKLISEEELIQDSVPPKPEPLPPELDEEDENIEMNPESDLSKEVNGEDDGEDDSLITAGTADP